MMMLARHLLLAALLLRALVPLGWMPGTAQLGEAAWIICTADGQIQHGTPGKDDGGRTQHQPCAFTAISTLAPPHGDALAALLPRAAILESGTAPAVRPAIAAFTPQAPRAPPIFL